eukprot:203413-Prymnesium_polylepis.1
MRRRLGQGGWAECASRSEGGCARRETAHRALAKDLFDIVREHHVHADVAVEGQRDCEGHVDGHVERRGREHERERRETEDRKVALVPQRDHLAAPIRCRNRGRWDGSAHRAVGGCARMGRGPRGTRQRLHVKLSGVGLTVDHVDGALSRCGTGCPEDTRCNSARQNRCAGAGTVRFGARRPYRRGTRARPPLA